jgi:uncharacterized protein YjbJ (UPF0337 family)
MTEPDDDPGQAPATWENVVVGKVKEVIGELTGDDELAAEGESQEHVARELHHDRDAHRA